MRRKNITTRNVIIILFIVLALMGVGFYLGSSIGVNPLEQKYNSLEIKYIEKIKESDSIRLANKKLSTEKWNLSQGLIGQKKIASQKDSTIIAHLKRQNANQQARIFNLQNGVIKGDTFICLDSAQVKELNIAKAICDSMSNQLDSEKNLTTGLLETVYALQVENESCLDGIGIRDDFIEEQRLVIKESFDKNAKLKKRGKVKTLISSGLSLVGGFLLGGVTK